MKVTLLGVGMGNGSLTTKAQAALGEADVLLGARRVLDSLPRLLRGAGRYLCLRGDSLLPPKPPRMPPGSGGLRAATPAFQRCAAAPPLVGGARHPSRGASRHLHGAGPRGPAGDSLAGILPGQRPWGGYRRPRPAAQPSISFLPHWGEVGPQHHVGEFCRAGLGDTLVTVASNLSYPEEEVVTATAKEDRPSGSSPL